MLCRSETGRGQAAASSDYFSSSFHSDADSSGISSSERSDVALTELMVNSCLFIILLLHDAMDSADYAVARCLSVSLSVTRQYSVKMAKHAIKLFFTIVTVTGSIG